MLLGTCVAVYFPGQSLGPTFGGVVGGGSRRVKVEGNLEEVVSHLGPLDSLAGSMWP